MPKSKSLTPTISTLGITNYYKHHYEGYLPKAADPHTKEKITRHPSSAAVRRNNAELRRSTKGGQLLRKAFHEIVHQAGTPQLHHRLVGRLHTILKSNTTLPHGERHISDGNIALLRAFEFNPHISFTDLFQAPLLPEQHNGHTHLIIPAFHAPTSVKAPPHATHIKLLSSLAILNFKTHTFQAHHQSSPALHIANHVPPCTITHTCHTQPTNVQIHIIAIIFYTQRNNTLRPMNQTTGQAATVIDSFLIQ